MAKKLTEGSTPIRAPKLVWTWRLRDWYLLGGIAAATVGWSLLYRAAAVDVSLPSFLFFGLPYWLIPAAVVLFSAPLLLPALLLYRSWSERVRTRDSLWIGRLLLLLALSFLGAAAFSVVPGFAVHLVEYLPQGTWPSIPEDRPLFGRLTLLTEWPMALAFFLAPLLRKRFR